MKKDGGQARPERNGPAQRWRGDAVEDRPGDEAERAAARAEGNAPVPVNVERDRIEEPDPGEQPRHAQQRPQHIDDPEEEIAETAEEHQERRDAGERPPRGKL
jgi:hypothetical protein